MNKIFKEIKVSNPSPKVPYFAQLRKFSTLSGAGLPSAVELMEWVITSGPQKQLHNP